MARLYWHLGSFRLQCLNSFALQRLGWSRRGGCRIALEFLPPCPPMLSLLPCEFADGRVVADGLAETLALYAELKVVQALRILYEACVSGLLEVLQVLEVAEEGWRAEDGLLGEGCRQGMHVAPQDSALACDIRREAVGRLAKLTLKVERIGQTLHKLQVRLESRPVRRLECRIICS